jgi:hypothetical protein
MLRLSLCVLLALAASCGGDDDGDLGDLVITDGTPGQADAPSQERSCAPSGSCLQGPPCGDTCCGSGEQCIAGELGPTCACGEGPACDVGLACESAGPVGEDGCGTICCGGTDPCPQ